MLLHLLANVALYSLAAVKRSQNEWLKVHG